MVAEHSPSRISARRQTRPVFKLEFSSTKPVSKPRQLRASKELPNNSLYGMAGDVCGAGTSFTFSAPVDEALSFDERGNLDRATLHGTIIATDVTSGTLVPARVDLVWTGTGPRESSVSRSRSNDQFMFHEQTKVISRNAVVTGTLIVSGQNLGVLAPLASPALAERGQTPFK